MEAITTLIGQKVKFNEQQSYSEGTVLDKIVCSEKHVHSTGMFHWKEDTPYVSLQEKYLIQVEYPFGKMKNAQGDIVPVEYRKKCLLVEATDIIEIIY